MRLLVTGCGRSGTKWLARCLTEAGLDCGHERAFTVADHGGSDWSAEVSWLAAPWTPIADAHVVHLVRHPLDVIRSRVATQVFEHRDRGRNEAGDPKPTLGPWGAFAYRWCPAMVDAPGPVWRAAAHWVQWNRLVVADELLRIEDVDAATVTRLARLVDPAAGIDVLPPAGERGGHPHGRPVTWAQVADVPHLAAMARGYGYG